MTKLMRIDCETASEIYLQNGSQLIDIRDQESYQAGHIADAIHIDNSSLSQFIASAETSQPLLIYCYHGNPSQQKASTINQGFERCILLMVDLNNGNIHHLQQRSQRLKKAQALTPLLQR